MEHYTTNLNDQENLKARRTLKPVQCIYDNCALVYLFFDALWGELAKYYYLASAVMLIFSIAVIIYNHKYEERKIVRLHSMGIAAAVFLMFLLNMSFMM